MNKLKADLKNAFQDLDIKKPLKLSGKMQFLVPTVDSSTAKVSIETKVDKIIQPSTAIQIDGKTTVQKSTVVPLETMDSNSTMAVDSSQVLNTTKDHSTTQVVLETKVPEVNDQDSAVTLEMRASPKLHQGYTRLPNSILMKIISGEFIRSEIQVLLVIARFTISFQKRFAPLSKSVFERQTGLRGPAVLQAVASLQQKGLIEKITGNQYKPNQLGLIFEDEFDFFQKKKSLESEETKVDLKTQDCKKTLVDKEILSKVAAKTSEEVSAQTYFKDSKTININNSLSQENFPKNLYEYFNKITAKRKRESEWILFLELKENFSIEKISQAFDFVMREKEKPHSPIAYLSKAIGDILKLADEQELKKQIQTLQDQDLVEKKYYQKIEELNGAEEFLRLESIFIKQHPDPNDQYQTLIQFKSKIPFLDTESPIYRRIAISYWIETLTIQKKNYNN